MDAIIPTIYIVTDGNCDEEIEATSPREAAQQYVDGGDWSGGEEPTKTDWITIYTRPVNCDGEGCASAGCDVYCDGSETITIELDPTEPACTEPAHDYRDDDNVRGSGGGVTYSFTCTHCGLMQIIDTWAQNRSTGEQGLRSVEYRSAVIGGV